MADLNNRVYLDYNATAPILPEVLGAVSETLAAVGNPSSVHQDGRERRAAVEDAREELAALLNCQPDSITFTSGGTEANAMAVSGLRQSGIVSDVFCSSTEHLSVLEHVDDSNRLPVDSNGLINLNVLDETLKAIGKPVLVCVMFANNETGVIQPIKDVSALVHEHGGYLLCDAVQALGKVSIDLATLGADLVSVSAHKMGGPQGVGALVNCAGLDLAPILIGGGQEKRKRSGTENTAGIVGFGTAALANRKLQTSSKVEELRTRLESALQSKRPESVVHSINVERLPNTTNISLPGVTSESQVISLDLAGFSVSAGSACSSGKMARSHVLEAMGLNPELSDSAIRISIGPTTKWQDLEQFIEVWSSF